MWVPAFRPEPGVIKDLPENQVPGRFRDTNLVRFRNGEVMPVGGWAKSTNTVLNGKARAGISWRENDGEERTAFGTNTKLYVIANRAVFDITPAGLVTGREYYTRGLGYGYGYWGTGYYGTSQAQTTPPSADVWTLDTWGEWLVGCLTGDGKIYRWQNVVANPATVVPNAPTNCRGVLVTPERYMMVWGAGGDSRLVQWSTVEDMTVWTPAATNTAGSLRLQSQGRILAGAKTRVGIIMFTENEPHVLRYLGYPFAYGSEPLGVRCGIVGPKAFCVIDTGVIWLAPSGWFRFDGALQPIPSPVQNWFFNRVNREQLGLVHTGHYSDYGEIWWFFPAGDSRECNEYIIYNYREGHWSVGQMERTVYLDRTAWSAPLAVNGSGTIYEHEIGWTDDGAPRNCFAETSAVDISGEKGGSTYVNRVIPDASGSLRMQIFARDYPQLAWRSFGTRNVRERIDMRIHGRQMKFRIENAADDDWRFAGAAFDARPGGNR